MAFAATFNRRTHHCKTGTLPLEQLHAAFQRGVLDDRASRPRKIAVSWFCDGTGAELFEVITAFPEYYVECIQRAVIWNRRGTEQHDA